MNEPEHLHHHNDAPSEIESRVKSLEALLIEKGLVDVAAMDALVDTYENRVGPKNGAQVVARAWTDDAYKKRLLDDATERDKRDGLCRSAGRAYARGREHFAAA